MRVVEGVVEVWVVGCWNWVRAGEFVMTVVVGFFVEVGLEVAKPRAPPVVKVDRRTTDDVEEDKVARRNRALVDCMRIVWLNDSCKL